MAADSSSCTSRMLLAAAASAAASSLLTYAALRLHGCRRRAAREPQAASSGAALPSSGEVARAAHSDPHDPSPRKGYLSWDDYFMAVAFLSAQRSKDPNKQVGACIVNAANVICGIGYNGFPRGCADASLPWAKRSLSNDPLETKYPYVCHAEMNAILNKNGASVAGARVYVTMFPCNECAKLMIQAGISEVVYHEDKDQPSRSDSTITSGSFNRDQQYEASRRLLALAGVKLRQHLFCRPVLLCLANGAPQAAAAAAAAPAASSKRGGSVAVAAVLHASAATFSPAVAAVLDNSGSNGGGADGSNGVAEAAADAAAAGSKRRRRGRRQLSRGPGGKNMQQQQQQQEAVPHPLSLVSV